MNVTRLKAKVEAVNKANAYAKQLCATLQTFFKPLVGQAVVNNDGGLSQRVLKKMPPELTVANVRMWQDRGRYSLRFGVQANAAADGCTVYHETTVYVGVLNGNVLESLSEPFDGRSDYTVAEVVAAGDARDRAKAVYDAAKSAMGPFGESY